MAAGRRDPNLIPDASRTRMSTVMSDFGPWLAQRSNKDRARLRNCKTVLSLRVAGPFRVNAIKRHRRDAHFCARILNLSAVDDINQRFILFVVDAAHSERLEDQAEPLGKHFFAASTHVDVADPDRASLATGY